VLGKERKEVAQFIHRKLLFLAARLVLLLLVTTPPAITVARRCASGALRLLRISLRSFFACGLCCAFLVAHSFSTPSGD
jgi:hypothetical protein